MVTVRELREWLAGFPDEAEVGVDDGGIELQCGESFYCVGGMPDPDEVDWRAEAEAQRERADDAERQLGRALR